MYRYRHNDVPKWYFTCTEVVLQKTHVPKLISYVPKSSCTETVHPFVPKLSCTESDLTRSTVDKNLRSNATSPSSVQSLCDGPYNRFAYPQAAKSVTLSVPSSRRFLDQPSRRCRYQRPSVKYGSADVRTADFKTCKMRMFFCWFLWMWLGKTRMRMH